MLFPLYKHDNHCYNLPRYDHRPKEENVAVSSKGLRISIRGSTLAALRIIPYLVPTCRVASNTAINARKRTAGLVERHIPNAKDRIGESHVEVDRVALAERIGKDYWLTDELVESMRGVLRG